MSTILTLTNEQAAFCKSMDFLFWWKKPNELARFPERTLAGVMDRGGITEWAEMERIFPPDFIIRVLETAVCGEFHAWSWKFWRLRYGLDANAPLPSRLPGGPAPVGGDWFKELQNHKPAHNTEFERLKWTFAVRDMEIGNAVQL